MASESGCSGLPDVRWLTRSHGSILVGVLPGTGVAAYRARVVRREVHEVDRVRRAEAILGVVERRVVRARARRASVHQRGRRDRGPGRGSRAAAALLLLLLAGAEVRLDGRQEAHLGAAVPAPELPHLLPALAHQGLVLGDAHLLAVDDAGALRARPIPVVRVLLHVQLRQPRLLLVVRLLLRVRHRLPSSTCRPTSFFISFIESLTHITRIFRN